MREQKTIGFSDDAPRTRHSQRYGFTLIELLVVISVVSVLLGILLPALNRVRHQARTLLGMSNQQQIVRAVNLFAMDHDDRYPESVATQGPSASWNWKEPMMLTSRLTGPREYRSMSAYLRVYLEDARALYCPKAPQRYRYLQAAWEAGEEWDNPDTFPVLDPVIGTYCFYWNYTGFLEDRAYLFQGPRDAIGGRRRSTLLVTDYLGYGHHRSPNAYGSCEKFPGVSVAEETPFSSAYWSRQGDGGSDVPDIKLRAGYADGHVERYLSSDTSTMRVISKPATREPYPVGMGPGKFYLPQNALH
ncbi:MAG: prepilin-type N-terminal cleavage/methylation domain-containing protein [Planctomycetes bacterium]|nr:prepilin-type N-terminal cleavage/methylation domain-containing protein [Planctomycetota bacterium]